jgi:hypothetical protein
LTLTGSSQLADEQTAQVVYGI